MDAFDRFWQWANKPVESSLTIPAELHRAVMELAPEDRPDRAAVNRAAARATELTLFLPGGLFLRPFTRAAPFLPFVGERGFPFRRLVDGTRGRLLRNMALRFAGGVRRSSVAAKIGGQFGMLAEGSVGSDRAPENDARLLHRGGDDAWIVAFLRRTLVEEIAVGAPRFQSRLHGGSRDRQIEEAQRSLVGLEFSRHATLPAYRRDHTIRRSVYLARRGSSKRAHSAAGPGYK